MRTKKNNPKKKVADATTSTIEESAPVEQTVSETTTVEQAPQKTAQSQTIEVKIDEIVPNPMNPRRFFDEESIAELAQSIIEHGVFQPIAIREKQTESGEKYEIIFGERRLRAVKSQDWKQFPVQSESLTMTTLLIL